MPADPLAVAHASPHPWDGGVHDIKTYVERTAAEQTRAGIAS